MFSIGDKVNTVKGKKIYTIVGRDEHGNFKMDNGAKFSASYLKPVKIDPVVDFFAKASQIAWEPK